MYYHRCIDIPGPVYISTYRVANDGLLLETSQMKNELDSVTVRVWLYCEVSRSSNTVSVLSVTLPESLVQVTMVAGPPEEIQVRVNRVIIPFASRVISTPSMIRSPGQNNVNVEEIRWAARHPASLKKAQTLGNDVLEVVLT